MDIQLSFKVSEKIYLKDPSQSVIGKNIIRYGIKMIHELGFESFTFKKLAQEIEITEATVYRYFENKHRLLLYILNWYWSYLEFMVMFKIQNLTEPREKLDAIIELLTTKLPTQIGGIDFDQELLYEIVVAESTKTFLIKDVNEINKHQVFKPYKDLCQSIAEVIIEIDDCYPYPHSLASTLVETAHAQQYFITHLPRLTDAGSLHAEAYTLGFLRDLIHKVLK
jgi:AcrR family transcriptional regulator